MTTSTTTVQFGRHVWSSLRDSVEVLAAKLPRRTRPPHRLGFDHSLSFHQPRISSNQSLPSGRWFSLPTQTRMSRGQVRRSCTSGGLLLLGLGSTPCSTNSVVATCTAAADSALSVNMMQKANISSLARQAWRQSLQNGKKGHAGRRHKSSEVQGEDATKTVTPAERARVEAKPSSPISKSDPALHENQSLADSVTRYLHLPHLPKMPHRPTKEELLAAASGFWSRLKVRFKWFSIRSMRPWNADEWGAFVSWFLFGHLVWILVGTTTFFSLIILFINTVFAQGTFEKS